MQTISERRRFVRRAIAAGIVSALVVPLAMAASAAAAPTGPQLSIAIDDGRKSAAAGDTLAYTITVRNLGADPVPGLSVTQTLPAGLTLVSASDAGVAGAAGENWQLDLGAHAEVTRRVTVKVGVTPKDLNRMASVACASASSTGPPIVCGSDSDLLPAGAVAAAALAAPGKATSSSSPNRYVLIVVPLLLVAAGVTVVVRRRRLARRTD